VYLYSARCGGGSFKRQSNVTTAKRKEKNTTALQRTPHHFKRHNDITKKTLANSLKF